MDQNMPWFIRKSNLLPDHSLEINQHREMFHEEMCQPQNYIMLTFCVECV